MDAGSRGLPAHPRTISAVIFDYGEVLCHPPSHEHLARMTAVFGIRREKFLPVCIASRNPYDRRDISADEYWRRFAESAGVEIHDSMIEKLRQWDIEMWTSINAKMVQWLGAIHTAGFRTAILSNMPSDMASHARQNFDWLHHFDHLILSCEVRAIKPDLAIFKRCLSDLGTQPGETLFIDDREKNIEAAHSLGIVGLLFQSIEKLCDDLRRVGFPILPAI
jgi:putative hydrolase of the HAD superfamily